jgi:hypothetical protein
MSGPKASSSARASPDAARATGDYIAEVSLTLRYRTEFRKHPGHRQIIIQLRSTPV